MILRDLLELINKEKRRKEKVKAARKFAIGMGVVAAVGVASGIVFAPKSGKETREDLKNIAVTTAETIKERVQKKAETVKDSAAHAAHEVVNVMKDIHEKTEGVKKNNKDGHHERQDS
jgi:gas vesicle protein